MDLGDEELRTLLSVSPEFERAVFVRKGSHGTPAISALRMLGELESVALASLAATRLAQVPNPTPTPSRASAPRPLPPVPARPATPNVGSARSEYRPALGDPSIVEALLEYHRGGGAPSAPARAPQSPRQAAPAQALQRPAQTFSSADPKRLSASDLEPRFPFDPSSKLLRSRVKPPGVP